MTPSSPFRILVTGSRTWEDKTAIRAALVPFRSRDAVLVHGDARGADRIAAGIWRDWGKCDEPHPADWERDGRAAGFARNQRMIDLGADVCLAFIQDHSRGASHTADRAEHAGIPTMRHRRAGTPRARTERGR